MQIKEFVKRKPFWLIILSIILGIAVNGLMNWINTSLGLPFFFDSIATAVVAALFGPLPGILVGLLTNLFLELIYGFPFIHYAFGLCGATTGFIVGMMAKHHRFGTMSYAILASLLVTLSNSLLGAVIATFMFGGITEVAVDYLVTGLMVAGQSLLSATFWARIPANLIDKTIAVFIAFMIYINLVANQNSRISGDQNILNQK